MPKSVTLQATKMRTNRDEIRPPRFFFCSGRILHGPTFRFLARPRDDEMIEVEYTTKKTITSFPVAFLEDELDTVLS